MLYEVITKPIELVGFIIDITDIKEKENNLLKTNKLLNFERDVITSYSIHYTKLYEIPMVFNWALTALRH